MVCKEPEFQMASTLSSVKVRHQFHFSLCSVGLVRNASFLWRALRFFTGVLTNAPELEGPAFNNGFFHTAQGLPLKSVAQYQTTETNLALVCGPYKVQVFLHCYRPIFSCVSVLLCTRKAAQSPGGFRKASSVFLACDASLTRSRLTIIGKSGPNK